MAYMKDSTGKRLDTFAVADRSDVDKKAVARPNVLVSTLQRGKQDATLLLLGDSTGNEETEWFYRTVQALAAQFPAYTVTYRLWADGTQSYAAPVTLQAGTGSRTLAVYNASVPGAGASYVYDPSVVGTRLPLLAPVEPTLTIFNYGYNWGQSAYRWEILRAVRVFRGFHPRSDIALVSQAPRAIGDAGASANAARNADVRVVAGQEGFGLIDAFAAFIEYGDYSADLVSQDGLHPNALGSGVWAEEAKRFLSGTQKVSEVRSAHQVGQRIYVPLSSFVASAGSPSLGVTSGLPAWAMDPSTNETISGTFDVPSEWGRVNVYLAWFTTATTGDLKITPRYAALSSWEGTASRGLYTPSAVGGQTIVSAQNPATNLRFTRIHLWDGTVPAEAPGRLANGRPLLCSITRDATDAADTLVADAYLVGLVVERAE